MQPAKQLCALFDLDGVLLDTEPLYTLASNRVLAEYGVALTPEIKRFIMGRNDLVGAAYVIDLFHLPLTPLEYVTRRRPILESLFPEAKPLPGAREFVEWLLENQTPIAIATSSKKPLYASKTAGNQWLLRVPHVVFGDDPRLGALKPSPDIFLLAARQAGAMPENCVVFEDSPAGIVAAGRAGMRVVGIAIDEAHCEGAPADVFARDFADPALHAWLENEFAIRFSTLLPQCAP